MYFTQMGNAWITLKTGETVLLNDITKFTAFMKSWENDPTLYLNYHIKDEERVDQISYHIYDSVEFWWTILLLNKIYNIEEQWPRSEKQLRNYIDNKYPFNNLNDIHHYVTPEGYVADLLALKLEHNIQNDNDLIYRMELTPVTIYEYEFQLNESKRAIKIIDPDYIGQVIQTYGEIMQ